MKNHKKYIYAGLPVLGVLFYLLYLYISSIDIIYSDYIRLTNSYLPDVWDIKKLLTPDLLTRIPINFLERGINVQFFGFSVTFDRVMGVLSFGLSALLVGGYCKKKNISLGWYAALMIFTFSLNKWEMLYNGTGWVHFLAFACFYYNYLVLDRVYAGKGKKGDVAKLTVLPALITIFVAGPYCAIYIVTLCIAYVGIQCRNWLIAYGKKPEAEPYAKSRQSGKSRKKRKENRFLLWLSGLFDSRSCKLTWKQLFIFLVMTIWPLFLYLWSHSHAIYEYSGATELTLKEALLGQPLFFVKFFLKSFASMVLGTELITRRLPEIPGKVWCLVGALVILTYVLAVWMNFYYKIVDKTLFPLMMLAGGVMNHMMILVSRWIFIPNDIYGMSSRYALQYQMGIAGMILTFALAAKAGKRRAEQDKKTKLDRILARTAMVITAVFVIGNVATTIEEFNFGKHRKVHNQYNHKLIWDFETEPDEALSRALEYSKDGVREALTILKENQWNIFGQDPPYYPELLDREPPQ